MPCSSSIARSKAASLSKLTSWYFRNRSRSGSKAPRLVFAMLPATVTTTAPSGAGSADATPGEASSRLASRRTEKTPARRAVFGISLSSMWTDRKRVEYGEGEYDSISLYGCRHLTQKKQVQK